eukprot:TRINITY_DN23361_c0_g2_i1.p1 TRINITY_DN23361_c0_g2~~TRINITY_DN23361_c0_g2_i1.p1  ORF type:complete len:601 (-),score=124.85 TRINITY_DN23361_c0_g2_i1:158-1870(-)
MGAAEERARRTVLQGGFGPGQRVQWQRAAGDPAAGDSSGGAPSSRGEGADAAAAVGAALESGTILSWLETEERWEVAPDAGGSARLALPASELRLEGIGCDIVEEYAEDDAAVAAGAADAQGGSGSSGGEAAPLWRGRQPCEEDADRGALVEVRRGAADVWEDAMIVSRTEAPGGGWSFRAVVMADLTEVRLPASRVRRKDNYLTHRRRVVACEIAREKLKKAKVVTSDVLDVLRKWPFLPNAARRNVLPEGKDWVFSDTFGLILSRTSAGCVESSLASQYPEMIQLFSRWLKDSPPKGYDRAFPFTSVNVNFDYAARAHRDARNAGPSMLRALGRFTGGRLEYYPDDDGSLPPGELPEAGRKRFDAAAAFRLFDGNRTHAVEPFEGERFSVVFYTSGGFERTQSGVKRALVNAGVTWPTQAALAYFRKQLPPPRGFKGYSSASSASSSQPGSAATASASAKVAQGSSAPAADGKAGGSAAVRRVASPLRKRPASAMAGGAASSGSASAAGQARKKRYKVLQFPHLHLKLDVGAVYTMESLVKRCRGDLEKATALRRKLADTTTFEEVLD